MNRSSVSSRTILIAVVLVSVATPAWAAGITITSQHPGDAVVRGQVVSVTVVPEAGTTLRQATAAIAPLQVVPQVLLAPPYEFTIQVPQNRIGSVRVTALALDVQGNTLEAYVDIFVTPT